MIITCPSCDKKFNIDTSLIPQQGRSLQCGFCEHKWFFKKTENKINIENEIYENLSENDSLENTDNNYHEINTILQKKDGAVSKKIRDKKVQKTIKKNPKIIKNSIVIIISIVAIILLIDTFKFQLNNYIPGIDSILNNLYESLKDLSLFINDLIN